MKQPRVLDQYFRARNVRFYHETYLKFLIDVCKFNAPTAGLIAHMALNERRMYNATHAHVR